MEIALLIVGILILGGIIGLFVQIQKKPVITNDSDPRLALELEQAHKEIEKQERLIKEQDRELADERSKKDEFAGKNKQLFVEMTELKSELKSIVKERDELQKKVTTFENSDARNRKDIAEQLAKLDSSKTALEKEQQRVIRADEERRLQEQAERDRIWNDHENAVIALMNELLMLPEYQSVFKGYSNTKLPDGFDGSLKPDFLIEFGSQYVIFDAKCTKSDDLTTYIRDAVKSTARKVKGKTEIYPTVFFVVPTLALKSLKKTSYHEQGNTFHIVAPEALGPIIAILKRMTEYEFVEQMNPEERENIVNALARYSQFISWKGAHDVIASQMGSELLRDTDLLLPELAKEVEMKRKKLTLPKPRSSDIMKLAASADARDEAVNNLTSPKATISKKTLRDAVEMEMFRE